MAHEYWFLARTRVNLLYIPYFLMGNQKTIKSFPNMGKLSKLNYSISLLLIVSDNQFSHIRKPAPMSSPNLSNFPIL
jgi:hypothetical protein